MMKIVYLLVLLMPWCFRSTEAKAEWTGFYTGIETTYTQRKDSFSFDFDPKPGSSSQSEKLSADHNYHGKCLVGGYGKRFDSFYVGIEGSVHTHNTKYPSSARRRLDMTPATATATYTHPAFPGWPASWPPTAFSSITPPTPATPFALTPPPPVVPPSPPPAPPSPLPLSSAPTSPYPFVPTAGVVVPVDIEADYTRGVVGGLGIKAGVILQERHLFFVKLRAQYSDDKVNFKIRDVYSDKVILDKTVRASSLVISPGVGYEYDWDKVRFFCSLNYLHPKKISLDYYSLHLSAQTRGYSCGVGIVMPL